jgi:HSP20 family protein
VPGIDPDKDVKITIDNGLLTIKAEWLEEKKEGGRSEFWYGSFTRSTTLPTGADPDDVTATYGDGILEVRVGIKPETKPERSASRSPRSDRLRRGQQARQAWRWVSE